MWRHLFAVGPVLFFISIVIGLARGPGGGPTRSEIQKQTRSAQHKEWDNAVALGPVIWCEISAIFFLFDSIRRKYRGSRAVAVALAVVGLLTLGWVSLVYYVIWGRHPIEPATEVYGTGFCGMPGCHRGPGRAQFNVA